MPGTPTRMNSPTSSPKTPAPPTSADNAPVSAKELFVLGRLSMRPTHGHEIMRTLAESRADLWVELSDKHVYYILRKLERAGLVEVNREKGAPAHRKTYTLTPDGAAEFERMMRSDALATTLPYSDFDVVFGMLAYTDRLAPAEKDAVLARRVEHLHAVVAQARAATSAATDTGASGLPMRIFDKTARVAEAELAWLEEVREDLARDGWGNARGVTEGNAR